MFEKLKKFFTTEAPVRATPAVAAPVVSAPMPVRRTCTDAINNPDPNAPFCDELMANRFRDIEWGIAVAAKVASWRLLIDMGSPQMVPADYRMRIMQAMATDDFEMKSMIYGLIQTNIMRNCPTVAHVKAF